WWSGPSRWGAGPNGSQAVEGGFRFFDEAADQLAGRHQLVDGTDSLPSRPELAIGIDAFGGLGTAEVAGPVLDRAHHLHGERLQLVGVLLEVGRVLVADHAAGLAGEGTGDGGAVL